MNFKKLLAGFISITIIASCSTVNIFTDNGDSTSTPASMDNVRNQLLTKARSYLGTGYRHSGTSSSGMDCSGLTHTVYRSISFDLPRTSDGQAKMGKKIDTGNAIPGDLVFFIKSGRIFHVGLVSKVNKNELWMIHSSSSKGVVEQEIFTNSYWRPKLYLVKSLL